jgi:hypothetical protein
MFRIGSESARWSRAHLRTLFVLIEGFFGATYQIISDRTGRAGRRWVTVEGNNVSRYSSLDLSIPKVKLLMILQGTPLAQPPHHLLMTLGRWRCVERLHIPAQVCEFFINSLQRHREVCMCLLEGGEGWMLSSRVSRFHEAQLFVKLILENERVSVCEPSGCAETNG